MTSLVHPFVARCRNVMEDARGKYFLMEALCRGELCELLYFENRFSEEWGMFYSPFRGAAENSEWTMIHRLKEDRSR